MSHPDVLRHSGPHTVEVSAGTKDASRRQSIERHADLTLAPHSERPVWHPGHAPQDPTTPSAQLMPVDAESTDVWMDEETISGRIEKLRQRNIQMTQSLKQLSKAAPREDPHE